jgi:RNA polymerase sigma-70 factor (ECF subfamily)
MTVIAPMLTRGREPSVGSATLCVIEEAVRRAQQGDAAALEVVVHALAPYVGRICGAVALDQGEDALQEAMVAIVKNLRSLREPAAVHAWARRIAVREAVRVASGSARSIPIDPSTLRVGVAVDDGATEVEVRAVLAQLSPSHRAVLVLRHLEGLDEAEMAEVLGVASGTVKSRLHRAGAAFRARWTS